MVYFQALTWDSSDEEDEHIIRIFGKTRVGQSVCVTTSFTPYFFVKIPHGYNKDAFMTCIRGACPEALSHFAVVKAKDMWGFQNGSESLFLQVYCHTLALRRRLGYRLRKPVRGIDTKLCIYESNVDPVLRLMHRTGIQSTGWVDTSASDCTRTYHTTADIELKCEDWKTLKPWATTDIAPFVVASVDIECYSSTGKFPDPNVLGDVCFQIAISLVHFGSDEPYDKTCLCFKKTDGDLPGCTIKSFDTEREMLMAYTEYLHEHDVDIITGWNIFGFDMEYIMERALITKCPLDFFNMSKIKDHTCNLLRKKLSSSALGDNELKIIPTPGRFIFDMFNEVKREYKLDSYKLNSVSKLYLGDQKIDMSPKEMFARFREGDPTKLREVAEYCIKDTLLPHKLLVKLSTLMNLLEMAKATWVPLNYLVERGQQIKVFSQLTKKAREMGFKVPSFDYGYTDNTGYEGATVLDAQAGAYYTPITALDFEGLYPSIMVAHNLCYSSLVMDSRYDNLPGVTYERFGKHTFVQNVPSVLPSILTELKEFRKQAKKDMANSTGAKKEMFNGKQLAYKISMNSVYGFTGASKGILPCVAIASTVTMKGRCMIDDTKTYVEKNFPGAKVRYGDTDSVMVEFDVGERTGKEAIEYSWELGERAARECTKLFKMPNNLELEKVYCPYFLYSKKRYAAKLWTKGKDGSMNMDYIDVKGLQLVRRDNTPHVREVCRELLNVILESNDTVAPKALARKRAVELLEGEVPNDKLVLSQQLGDSYKSSNLAHVQVRDKMKLRQPGSEPQSGDRIPYILLDTGDHNAKAFEKSENPEYAIENGLKVDYIYYFKNKFLNPVCDLLEPLFTNPKEEIFGELVRQSKPPKKPRVLKVTKGAKTPGKTQLLVSDLFKR
jgi:DNA polymerase delta subunit 1